MRVTDSSLPIQPLRAGTPARVPTRDFAAQMQEYLADVNQLQNQSETAAQQLALGQIEFHDAMIVTEQANLALQLTMAVRNKIMDAYQEIMRMQV